MSEKKSSAAQEHLAAPASPATRRRTGSISEMFSKIGRRRSVTHSGAVDGEGQSKPLGQKTKSQLALNLETALATETLPAALGTLMFSPRADKLSDEHRINPKDLEGAQLIQKHDVVDVFKALYKGQPVMQKVIRYANIDDNVLSNFEKEIAVISTLEHPNIVRFIGAHATAPDLFVVNEWMEFGSLWNVLRTAPVELSWTNRLGWTRDVAKAVSFLHSLKPKLVHRDLRVQNVLVNAQGAKISEFALAKRKRFQMKPSPRAASTSPSSSPPGKQEEKEDHSFVVTGGVAYTAPELLTGGVYDEHVDSYNFGLLLWQVLTRSRLYEDFSDREIVEGVTKNDLRPEIPSFVPAPLADFVRTCWRAAPAERPAFLDILTALSAFGKLTIDFPPVDVEESKDTMEMM